MIALDKKWDLIEDTEVMSSNLAEAAARKTDLPSVVVLGGDVIALSVVRCLGRRGIHVYVVNKLRHNKMVKASRFCGTFIAVPQELNVQEFWSTYLLGEESKELHGSVLLACNDDAIDMIINNKEKLEKKYILDIMDKRAQKCALDKLCTYESALNAGVPTPRFSVVDYSQRYNAITSEVSYPIIVKPVYSHLFQKKYPFKNLLAKNAGELREVFDKIEGYEGEVILLEFIEGSDDKLCSYYTYIDQDGRPLFNYTKRIIRRYPINQGPACYHITDRVDEIENLSLRFFQSIGLRGLANAEFKLDSRDGKLKLIECNARFTGANGLLARNGLDLASLVYNRLAEIPQEIPSAFAQGKRLWDPEKDFKAFLELRRRGEISSLEWLKSVMHPQTFPYFAWDDPMPTVGVQTNTLARLMKKIYGKIVGYF